MNDLNNREAIEVIERFFQTDIQTIRKALNPDPDIIILSREVLEDIKADNGAHGSQAPYEIGITVGYNMAIEQILDGDIGKPLKRKFKDE
jgi:hypothetical protein